MYDFDHVIDRRETNSVKWGRARLGLTPEQRAADPLPMWVADMDFRVAPRVLEALREQIDFGVLGYDRTPESYIEAVVGWQARRFGWQARPEWLLQTPGVVSALNIAIQAFSEPGDHVLVQPPIYYHFLRDVITNQRRLALAPLALRDGRYFFDPAAFEEAIRPNTKLFILCNPHNPTGNVWTRDELASMAQICERHDILIVSDEIHQDLVFGEGKQHIPIAALGESVAQRTITCTSPSKTFNLAGLSCANVFIPDEKLRRLFRTHCERSGLFLINSMALVACEAAYRHGEDWVDAMLDYVRSNQRHFARRVVETGLPIAVTPTDSLYLAWLDFRKLGLSPGRLHDFLLRKARLWLEPGDKFGAAGEGFMRINLACPRSIVDDALTRLEAVKAG